MAESRLSHRDMPAELRGVLPEEVWTRLAPYLDLEDPDCLLMLARVDLASLDFSRPMDPKRRRRLESAVLGFERWLKVSGLAPMDELDDERLRRAAEAWMAWLASDVSPDHPALRVNGAGLPRGGLRGYRTTTQALKNLSPYRVALDWWAESNGRVSPLTSRARLIPSARAAEPPLQARALTNEDLVAAVGVLEKETVVAIGDPLRSRLWHLRERAALLVSLFALLRISERAKLRDDQVVAISEEGVSLRMLRTKHHLEGRIVTLQPRDDLLCPVRALTEFLSLCAELDLDREGLLLPVVLRRRAPLRPPVNDVELRNWSLLAKAAGLDTAPEVLDGTLSAGSHGLRATLLTRAVAAKWDPEDLLRLGGWRSFQTALRYDRCHDENWELAEMMGL